MCQIRRAVGGLQLAPHSLGLGLFHVALLIKDMARLLFQADQQVFFNHPAVQRACRALLPFHLHR